MRADIKWLDNPEVFRVNQLAAHSDHDYFLNYEDFESKNSGLVQSLNGKWSFQFSVNAESRPVNFYEEKIIQVENKVDKLEEDMPLFQIDCKEIQALVRKKGIEALGGYKSVAYNDNSLRGKVYSDIQHQIRREFGVSRYEAIKRSQLEMAKEIISNYKVPLVLENEIKLLNEGE